MGPNKEATVSDEWKPPFCVLETGAENLECPNCHHVGSVMVRQQETYRDGESVDAYCSECHDDLYVQSLVEVTFAFPERAI